MTIGRKRENLGLFKLRNVRLCNPFLLIVVIKNDGTILAAGVCGPAGSTE